MAENIFISPSGDTSRTQQYLDTFRRSEHLEPEKALFAAILEDAVHSYRKYGQARDRQGKERFREAQEWIMEGGNDWIFSFRNVCECLDLDPDYVRSGLREGKRKIEVAEKPRHRRAGISPRAASRLSRLKIYRARLRHKGSMFSVRKAPQPVIVP